MNLRDVISRFELICDFQQHEISKYMPFILDAMKYIESKTEGRTFNEVDMMRLSHAAAVFAYYKCTLYPSVSGISRLKAGDIELTQSENTAENARELWNTEKAEISDLIDMGGFCFKQVGA